MGVDFGFEKTMLQMITDYKLENIVTVIRNPPRNDVLAAYKESKFLVLPSRWELSPLTPLEGFAFKKPVISSNLHGIPYTIQNNVNGLLVDPENSTELGEAILDLLVNEKKCIEYGISGYNLVHSTCNSKTMVENTLKIYHEIINR
jgi:glycosyltransferase involved in cell wall biosynthesis